MRRPYFIKDYSTVRAIHSCSVASRFGLDRSKLRLLFDECICLHIEYTRLPEVLCVCFHPPPHTLSKMLQYVCVIMHAQIVHAQIVLCV